MCRKLGASPAPETEQCWPALRRVHGGMSSWFAPSLRGRRVEDTKTGSEPTT